MRIFTRTGCGRLATVRERGPIHSSKTGSSSRPQRTHGRPRAIYGRPVSRSGGLLAAAMTGWPCHEAAG